MAMNANYQPAVPAGSYPVDRIGAQLSELSELIDMLGKQAAHICGSVPQAESLEAKLAAAPNGLIDEWQARLDGLIDKARATATRLAETTGF